MLFNALQLILNCKKVYTDLSIKDIQKTVDEVFVNDLEPLKETIANPIFGFFADKTGLIYNIRFFSPYIDEKTNNSKRDFIKDKSNDLITSLVIRLYPSPTGQLVTNTAGSSNPFKNFKTDMDESVRFLARIFVAILNDETDFPLEEIKSKILSSASTFDPKISKHRMDLFKEIKKKILNKNADSIFEDKTIRLLILHSYIINIFDPSINSGTADNLKLYLSEIGRLYIQHPTAGGSTAKKFLDIKVDKVVLQAAMDYYESEDSSNFPYSRLNPPKSNKHIPSYIRKKVVNGNVEVVDKFSYEPEDMFSDCADITLLHICNCLFFDNTLSKTKDFKLDHLPDNIYSEALKDFYRNHPKKYTLTDEIRNDWSKVIQDLNEGNDDMSKYPTDHISYKNLKHNEVKSGIINMMNVLIKITGLDAIDFLDNINNFNLEERLKLLIDRLSIKEKRDGINEQSVATVELEEKTIKEFDTEIKSKKDFLGTFKIDFRYLNAPPRHIYVCFKDGHGFVRLDQGESKAFFSNYKEGVLKRKLSSDCFHNLLFRSFLFPEETKLGNNKINEFKKLFLGGRIDNNDSSVKILYRICEFATTFNDKKLIEKVEKIISLIFGIVDLSDRGTRATFENFLCFKTSAIQNDDINGIIISYLNYSNYQTLYLLNKWDEFFSKDLPVFEKFHLNKICISRNKFDSIPKLISKFVNLKEVQISACNLNETQLEKIIENLKFPEKLTKLNVSYNKKLIIPENIQKLTSLKKLDVSGCRMNLIPDSVFLLNSLEELNLSFNNRFVIPENIKNLTNLKVLNISHCEMDFIPDSIFLLNSLENLDVSFNRIRFVPINIKNLRDLKVLNISCNEIKNLPIEFKELTKLENLNVQRNNISNLTFGNISYLKYFNLKYVKRLHIFLEQICDFTNLEELNISENNTFDVIPKNFEKLSKLKILNIENTKIQYLPPELLKLENLEIFVAATSDLSAKTQDIFKEKIKIRG